MKQTGGVKALLSLIVMGLSALLLLPSGVSLATCLTDETMAIYEKQYPATLGLVKDLESFAQENNLPMKSIKVGPPDRQIERMFVAVDYDNPELMAKYLQRFNLKDAHEGQAFYKTLPIEFQYENGDGRYTFGYVREATDPTGGIYRWGALNKHGQNYKAAIDSWRGATKADEPFYGFAHLIGLEKSEADNLDIYLTHPEWRAPCKSDNCIAWISSIELGQTGEGAPIDTRKFLFNELGVARSMAHFEIARRLTHAANERHGAMVVFVKGEKGLKTFETELEKHLPPAPKTAYEAIIRGYGFAPESPVMQAAKVVPDGAKVFVPIAAGASAETVAALIQAVRMNPDAYPHGINLHMLTNGISEVTLNKAVEAEGGKIKLTALFLGGNLRNLNRQGKVAYIPGYLSDFPRMVADPNNAEFHYDAILLRVSPPDKKGMCSLGPNNDMIDTILKARPDIKIIAEINPNVPHTNGLSISKDRFAASYESIAPLASPPVVPLSGVEKNIGASLGELVPDNAWLQVGIGNIFGGLTEGIRNKNRKGIRVFTELFGEQMKELMESGNIVDAETGFAFGSEGMYKWLDNNKKVKFSPTIYVNDPGRVAEMENFHAINTALQVDVLGNVNATRGMDGFRMSSPGGQVEFMSGASRSNQGKSIIAIRSTAKNGTISSIVLPKGRYGGEVTTPAEMVTHVVTEYGVAAIRGKSENERTMAIIRIAHPKFRGQLADDALAEGMISAQQADTLKQEAQNVQEVQ